MAPEVRYRSFMKSFVDKHGKEEGMVQFKLWYENLDRAVAGMKNKYESIEQKRELRKAKVLTVREVAIMNVTIRKTIPKKK
jgi:hypothetical protein